MSQPPMSFPIPLIALGPGSQPDDEEPHYLPMPRAMRTFRGPSLPDAEVMAELTPARAVLQRTQAAARVATSAARPGPGTVRIALDGLDGRNLGLIDQILGEGEVSAKVATGDGPIRVQESVFAGIWRVRTFDHSDTCVADAIEVGELPEAVARAGCDGRPLPVAPASVPPGAASALALLAEIAEHLRSAASQHVVNLTLLPFSPEDGDALEQALGRGAVSLLSRGYGNCRISATGVARLWWVQYFNSQDLMILNTLEIADTPEVARAAPQDLEDSALRLGEVLDWIH